MQLGAVTVLGHAGAQPSKLGSNLYSQVELNQNFNHIIT